MPAKAKPIASARADPIFMLRSPLQVVFFVFSM